jgi:hypothetical protein
MLNFMLTRQEPYASAGLTNQFEILMRVGVEGLRPNLPLIKGEAREAPVAAETSKADVASGERASSVDSLAPKDGAPSQKVPGKILLDHDSSLIPIEADNLKNSSTGTELPPGGALEPVPPEVATLVEWCWAEDQKERPSFTQVLRSLEEAQAVVAESNAFDAPRSSKKLSI